MSKCDNCPINKIIDLLDRIVEHCNKCREEGKNV